MLWGFTRMGRYKYSRPLEEIEINICKSIHKTMLQHGITGGIRILAEARSVDIGNMTSAIGTRDRLAYLREINKSLEEENELTRKPISTKNIKEPKTDKSGNA